MQSFFEAPKDIIGILGEKLTDYATILESLNSAKDFPATYNRLRDNIKAIITIPDKYDLKVNDLMIFPNLEIIEVQIIGTITDLLKLATLPKLRTFNFKFPSSYKKQDEDMNTFFRTYCTNRDLKKVNFQMYNEDFSEDNPLLLLVGSQLFWGFSNRKVYRTLTKFAFINGIWNYTLYKPPRDYVKHFFITQNDLQYKIYEDPRTPRIKYHFTSNNSENQILDFCYSFWSKLLGYSYPNIVQFDVPVLLANLQSIDAITFSIFPNVKEFMVFPYFKVDKPIIEYKGRIIKFYKPPNNNELIQENLPELPTYKTIYDTIVAENNLQNKIK